MKKQVPVGNSLVAHLAPLPDVDGSSKAHEPMMKHVGRRAIGPLAAAMVALIAGVFLSARSDAGQSVDQFTPVLASPVAPKSAPALGTDGNYHVVYELMLTNATQFAAALEKIEVLDGRKPSRALAAFQGGDLVSRLKVLLNRPATDLKIEPASVRLVFLDLSLAHAPTFPTPCCTA